MKKVTATAKEIIFTILLFPVVLIFLLGLLIITPFDYIKYKRTRYYKDTHERYSWFCTSSYYIKLYDRIKNENIPINYYRFDYIPITGYGYFIYKDILILSDYEPCFDEEKKIWTVEIEDECVEIKDDVECSIARCNNFLKNDLCKSAVVLVDSEVLKEYPNVKYENFCFLAVDNGNAIEALKQ